MRQAGVIAAAALYALDHHVERLAEDHRNARVIAQAIADTPGLRLEPPEVETNLIWFEVDPDLGTARDVSAALKQRGVLVHVAGPHTLRACTHLDVSAAAGGTRGGDHPAEPGAPGGGSMSQTVCKEKNFMPCSEFA